MYIYTELYKDAVHVNIVCVFFVKGAWSNILLEVLCFIGKWITERSKIKFWLKIHWHGLSKMYVFCFHFFVSWLFPLSHLNNHFWNVLPLRCLILVKTMCMLNFTSRCFKDDAKAACLLLLHQNAHFVSACIQHVAKYSLPLGGAAFARIVHGCACWTSKNWTFSIPIFTQSHLWVLVLVYKFERKTPNFAQICCFSP